MEKCVDCQVDLNYVNSMPNGRCKKCHGKFLAATLDGASLSKLKSDSLRPEGMGARERLKVEDRFEEDRRKKAAKIDAIMLTTETGPNLNITKRIEIVTAECAFGMNVFRDLFASVRDIVGGRSEAVQKTMRDSRKTALYELKAEAHAVGANAVVGVDLDYVELSAAGSMVMLVASGTAVIIED